MTATKNRSPRTSAKARTAKKDDAIYGSTLSRNDLIHLLPQGQPIPFVYVYACLVTLDLGNAELVRKLEAIRDDITDFASVQDLGEHGVNLAFTKKQFGILFKRRNDGMVVEMNFREHGRKWGSNFLLWRFHQAWIFDKLGAVFIHDVMDHVNPADIRLPIL